MNSSSYCFVSLYQSYPSYHGASDISYNLFNKWPSENKVLIQISEKNISKKKIINLKKKNRTDWKFNKYSFNCVKIKKIF